MTDTEVPVKATWGQGRWVHLSVCGRRMEDWGLEGVGAGVIHMVHMDAEEDV